MNLKSEPKYKSCVHLRYFQHWLIFHPVFNQTQIQFKTVQCHIESAFHILNWSWTWTLNHNRKVMCTLNIFNFGWSFIQFSTKPKYNLKYYHFILICFSHPKLIVNQNIKLCAPLILSTGCSFIQFSTKCKYNLEYHYFIMNLLFTTNCYMVAI